MTEFKGKKPTRQDLDMMGYSQLYQERVATGKETFEDLKGKLFGDGADVSRTLLRLAGATSRKFAQLGRQIPPSPTDQRTGLEAGKAIVKRGRQVIRR